MKRNVAIALILPVFIAAILLLTAHFPFAADHEQMHEMMMKQGGPKSDDRTELKLPEPVKVMHKKIMRAHLNTLAEITAFLAVNNLQKAAEVAKNELGWNQEEEKRCSLFASMVKDDRLFNVLGKAMHQQADELAQAAKAGNRDKALSAMAELINRCNACHDKFRD
ncbi:MAG: cytochrome c [Deltaproteobacteria bacterium]|nr:cytochrome c [Deltaproteobacteria bacterium]